MTQFSMFWTTTPGGVGDGAAPYTSANWFTFLRSLLLSAPTAEGVLAGFDNELAVTGAASPLSVNTGGAVVYGSPYTNDASVSLTVTTPVVGNTGGHVILRADWAAETVRLVAVRNTDGNAATPSLTQTAGTTWEIRLATFVITTLGVITLTDARDYCHFNIAPIWSRQGDATSAWDAYGTTNHNTGGQMMQVGAQRIVISAGVPDNTVTVTWPRAFTSVPICFASTWDLGGPGNPTSRGTCVANGGAPLTQGFLKVTRRDPAVMGADEVVFANWLAIGSV